MRVDQAKSIRLDVFLQNLGHLPVRVQSGCKWYKSPFRQENSASFKLSRDARAYYDHAEGKGGNIIELAQRMGQLNTVSEALAFIENTVGDLHILDTTGGQHQQLQTAPPSFQIISAQPFQFPVTAPWASSAQWLLQRAIDPAAMAPFLQQIRFARFNKPQFVQAAIGIANLAGGYEAREAAADFRKISIGAKAISVFRAQRTADRDNTLHIFEGLPDFGSYLTRNRRKDNPIPTETENFMVLNGTGMLGQALDYLNQDSFRFVAVWAQYGQGGQLMEERILHFLRQRNRPGGSTKELYPPPPNCSPDILKKWDLNAWWVNQNLPQR